MDILVDLHHLNPPFTGKAVYTRNLFIAAQLDKRFDRHRWHFIGYPDLNFNLSNKTNISYNHIPNHQSPHWYFYTQTHKINPDIVISPSSYITSFLSPKPVISIIYDLAFKEEGRGFKTNKKAQLIESALIKPVIAKSHALITISDFIFQQLNQEYPSLKPKLFVVKGAYSVLHSYQKPKAIPTLNYPFILSVGTLEPRKNVYNLIQGFLKFCQSSPKPPPKLVIVGKKGWSYGPIINLLNQAETRQHVVYLDYVTDGELIWLYQHCRFFASVPFYEGFGLPFIEAISHGKACLTSDQAALPEVVGPCGILADPSNIDQIAERFSQLNNPKKLIALEKNTFSWAEKYSPKAQVDPFFSVIDFMARRK
jgi:glycosyltransferase involved in cell wall biosynthesis